jgi:hypothetical protein
MLSYVVLAMLLGASYELCFFGLLNPYTLLGGLRESLRGPIF